MHDELHFCLCFFNFQNFQTLPNGERKVVERFDCSGCGDVTMSALVTATSDTIIGLSGRSLKLSNFMKSSNIGSDYKLGLKNLMDLYPSRVRDKILADAKLKQWDEANKKALSDVAREIAEFETKNSSEFAVVNPNHTIISLFIFQTQTISVSKTSL